MVSIYSKYTWHPVEKSFSSTIVGLQEATVHRPVQMSDEASGFVALAHFFKALGDGVDVHQAVVGAHRQVAAVWGKLELMNDLLPVFDMHHFCHVSETQENN